MEAYEYKIYKATNTKNVLTTADLNKLGADRWELISLNEVKNRTIFGKDKLLYTQYIFKRKLIK